MQSTVPSGVATRSSARTHAGTSSGLTLAGLMREVCRMVPPVRSMVRTESRVRGMVHSPSALGSSGLICTTLNQPRRRPTTSMSCCSARLTTALIATFRPGTSPPPVRIPIRRFAVIGTYSRSPVRRRAISSAPQRRRSAWDAFIPGRAIRANWPHAPARTPCRESKFVGRGMEPRSLRTHATRSAFLLSWAIRMTRRRRMVLPYRPSAGEVERVPVMVSVPLEENSPVAAALLVAVTAHPPAGGWGG